MMTRRILSLLVIILLSVAGSSPDCFAGDDNNASSAAIKCGEECLEKDDVAGALTAFTKANELDRRNAQAFVSRACAYKRSGDETKASADITEAIRLDPKAARAYFIRNWAYGRKRELDRVIHYVYGYVDVRDPTAARAPKGDANAAPWEYSFGCRPDDAAARGSCYFFKGEFDRTIADYSAVVRLKPTDAIAFGCRGMAYAEIGEFDKAIADVNEAIRLNRGVAEAYATRAFLYADKQIVDKADSDGTKAVTLAPNLPYASFCRGYALWKKGDRAAADKAFAAAVRLESSQKHEMELKRIRSYLSEVDTLALVFLGLGELQDEDCWKFLRVSPSQEKKLHAIIADYEDQCLDADQSAKKSPEPAKQSNEFMALNHIPSSPTLAKAAIEQVKATLTAEQWKAYNRLQFIPAAEKVIWHPDLFESLHLTRQQRDQIARLSKECRNSVDFPDEPRGIPYQVYHDDSVKDTWEGETKKKAKAVAPEREPKNEIRGKQLARENAKKVLAVLTPQQQDALLELIEKEAHR
jgi:tetratricopeptide (TPR) repeat protein